MSAVVDVMTPGDWAAVRAIYLEGIATNNATFEQRAPEWAAWDKKYLQPCRLVARSDGLITGWAVLAPYSTRAVYAGVAESSVYVAASARGQGHGFLLLDALVTASEAAGFWTLQAGIFPENIASVRLHERCGFRIVGRRERIGQMHGVWRDVLLLERRSSIVGI